MRSTNSKPKESLLEIQDQERRQMAAMQAQSNGPNYDKKITSPNAGSWAGKTNAWGGNNSPQAQRPGWNNNVSPTNQYNYTNPDQIAQTMGHYDEAIKIVQNNNVSVEGVWKF